MSNSEVIRVPFVPPEESEVEIVPAVNTFKIADATPTSPCNTCGSNPKNGGSGICNCTLGNPSINC